MPVGFRTPPCLLPWPKDWPIIPRDQWPDMIREQKGTFLSDLIRGKLPIHNQGSTSRCWAHGSVRSVEINRFYQGQPPTLLSPDSVAYPIEGTRDNGGYPGDACKQLATGGACDQNLWPERDLSPRRADPNWESNALRNALLQWIVPETWEQQMTLAFRRVPIAIGLRWWGHLVCQTAPELIGQNEVGIRIDNSWGSDWKENGTAVLDEESGTADLGAFAPISTTFPDPQP